MLLPSLRQRLTYHLEFVEPLQPIQGYAAYDTHQEETERLKTLIVVEEAHSLLPNRVSPDAKGVSTEVRNLIDRIARELRKYGVNLLLITQSLSDFQREARMVREMTNTKFFMRTIDRTETQLVEQYISEGASQLRL